jgi:hypothetical protein
MRIKKGGGWSGRWRGRIKESEREQDLKNKSDGRGRVRESEIKKIKNGRGREKENKKI